MSSKVGALVGPYAVARFIDDSIFLVGLLFTSGWVAAVAVLFALGAAAARRARPPPPDGETAAAVV